MPPLTDAFLAAADERGFPVVEVPLPVPFISISQEVAAATAASPPSVPGGYVLPVSGPRSTAGYILAMVARPARRLNAGSRMRSRRTVECAA